MLSYIKYYIIKLDICICHTNCLIALRQLCEVKAMKCVIQIMLLCMRAWPLVRSKRCLGNMVGLFKLTNEFILLLYLLAYSKYCPVLASKVHSLVELNVNRAQCWQLMLTGQCWQHYNSSFLVEYILLITN